MPIPLRVLFIEDSEDDAALQVRLLAQAGYDVAVRELDQQKLDTGLGKISKQLSRGVEKGRMEQAQADDFHSLRTIEKTIREESLQ